MRFHKLTPLRYQLTKHAVAILRQRQPWIFRSHLSTALDKIPLGQWLKLVNSENQVVGFGVRETQGVIGIRVLSYTSAFPDVAHWDRIVEKAITRRENVRKYSNAFRLLHGENDGTPGVVIDIYNEVGVLQTYSPAIDGLGRYLARIASNKLRLESMWWRLPAKRQREEKKSTRVLRGAPPDVVHFKEGNLVITVSLHSGQKGGAFLDLRNLRKWLLLRRDLRGARVLNLFSYTGTLGLVCETAGASEVWNVDIARPALDFGKRYHTLPRSKTRFIEGDVFEWIKTLRSSERFDLIIVDPPQMASRTTQVKTALRAYQSLVECCRQHLRPGGRIVVTCCTSRIDRHVFEKLLEAILGREMRLEAKLRNEEDHPVIFREADYLKIVIYRL